MFSETDPYGGVDLDNCHDPATGAIMSPASEIIQEFASYTEVSPSKKGFKLFVRGKLPGRGRHADGIEVYSHNHYFTITGWHFPGTPTTIEPRQAEFLKLYERLFTPRTDAPVGVQISQPWQRLDLEDDELIQRAMNAKNGEKFRRLWQGDTSEYPTDSEATLALCQMLTFWVGSDHKRIDRLFRQSGLMRPKWDEARKDSTWGADRIRKAIATSNGRARVTHSTGATSYGRARVLHSYTPPPNDPTSVLHRHIHRVGVVSVYHRPGDAVPVCHVSDATPPDTADDAIARTLPTSARVWRKKLFALCRHLRALPEYAHAGAEAMRAVVERWARLVCAVVKNLTPEKVWDAFVAALPRVQSVAGAGPVEALWDDSAGAKLPAEALRYPAGSPLRHVVTFCRLLQRNAGLGVPWPLACRVLARLTGTAHMTAARWLRQLLDDGVLLLRTKGTKASGWASTYQFVANKGK
jgi:hypothetical protein